MGVDHCGLKAAVPKELLNGSDIVPVLKQMGRKRMAQGRLSAWAQREIGFVAIPGHAVVEMVNSDLHWALNAGTEYTKIFVPDEIKWLKESVEGSKGKETVLDAGTQILIGAPANIPPGLVDSLKANLTRNIEVKEAYLGQVYYGKEGEKPHLALVLRLDTSSEVILDAIRKDLSMSIRGLLDENEYIDFHLDDGGTVSTEVIRAVEPFYIRKK